ncbi:hypothetical protein CMI42_04340 [Candidatus Pacearchaeota archaeon]|nr:hypothetical protein [Candidatus Pacearchaeota archaeon]|tara:strand:+ start:221 stop:1753 length:1533 start_codon:yes stop_codon:yes gene_type:complete
MKKEKILIIVFISMIMVSFSFVQGEIIKTTKSSYNTGESVRAISNVGLNDKLCRSSSDEEVKLYVVQNNDQWVGGENFNDVRNDVSLVPNKRFSSKIIWEEVKTGDFDMVVDCDDDGIYDLGEPVFNEGFSVVAKKGIGRVLDGLEMEDFSWYYDSEEVDLDKEMLSLKFSGEHEGISLKNLTVEFSNREGLDLDRLEIYVDKNNNGKLNAVDLKIGEFVPSGLVEDRERVTINLNYDLVQGVESLLFVYKLKPSVLEGEYSFQLLSVYGEGELSKEMIKFFGLKRESVKLEVLPEKSCLGSINLNVNPKTALKGGDVILRASNLSGCGDREVSLRATACYLPKREIGKCTLSEGKCEVNTIAQGDQTYYACLDKNLDGDFVDVGESVSDGFVLKVEVKEVVEETNDEDNESSENNGEGNGGGITGNVVNEENNNVLLGASDSFLVLLEVTLLLILFVLIMILFKLRGPVSGDSSENEGDESGWDEDDDKRDDKDKKEDVDEDDEEDLLA